MTYANEFIVFLSGQPFQGWLYIACTLLLVIYSQLKTTLSSLKTYNKEAETEMVHGMRVTVFWNIQETIVLCLPIFLSRLNLISLARQPFCEIKIYLWTGRVVGYYIFSILCKAFESATLNSLKMNVMVTDK